MAPYDRVAILAGSFLLSLVLACTSSPEPSQPFATGATRSASPAASAHPSPSPPPASPPPSPTDRPFSLDAVTWQTVTEPFDGDRGQDVKGLFVNAYGDLVAWGADQGASSDELPTFWSSVDGVNWREASLEALGENLVIVDVAHGPRGFVAVGSAHVSGAAWSSPDGVSWGRATTEPSGTPDMTGIRAVAAGTEGFLAVGGDRDLAAAWFSPSGDVWTRVATDFPAGTFWDVTQARDGGFVVVGIDQSRHDWNGAAWVVSRDGLDWRAANATDALAGPDDDHMRRLWSFAGGYVAFGHELDPRDRRLCHTCFFDREAWRIYTSPDGIDWTRNTIDLKTATGEPALVDFSAIEPWEDGLIAVGTGTDHQVRVWLSSDGVQWASVGEPVTLGSSANGEPSVADLLVADGHLVIGGSLLGGGSYVIIGTAR